MRITFKAAAPQPDAGVSRLEHAGYAQPEVTSSDNAPSSVTATNLGSIYELVGVDLAPSLWEGHKLEPASESANPGTSRESASSSFQAEAPETSTLVAREDRQDKRFWYALTITQHTAATFDAWTTRRLIEPGYGYEKNLLLRPFSRSWTMYGAIQVAPALFAYTGHRMRKSSNRWLRRLWWVPQTASAFVHIRAGVHNLAVYRTARQQQDSLQSGSPADPSCLFTGYRLQAAYPPKCGK